MSKRLVILGASGNAHDVLDIVDALNEVRPSWRVMGFLDDRILQDSSCRDSVKVNAASVAGDHHCFEVLGPLSVARELNGCRFVTCIGSEHSYSMRPRIVAKMGIPESSFATLIHPQANVSSRARLGHGVYVSFGACVGGGSVIGNHVAIAPNVVVGHDCQINDFGILAPGVVVSGYVTVGEASYLGARSVVKQNLEVGASALVGMGAVVTRSVEPGSRVAGVPARKILTQHSVIG